MIEQVLPFDAIERAQAVPRSACGDPESSCRAEEAFRSSRRMKSQAIEVLALVREWPGMTSKQLAKLGNLDRYQIARRLPELLNAKLVTRSDSDRESRWWAV